MWRDPSRGVPADWDVGLDTDLHAKCRVGPAFWSYPEGFGLPAGQQREHHWSLAVASRCRGRLVSHPNLWRQLGPSQTKIEGHLKADRIEFDVWREGEDQRYHPVAYLIPN
jgi:hypothetical protein